MGKSDFFLVIDPSFIFKIVENANHCAPTNDVENCFKNCHTNVVFDVNNICFIVT